MHELRDRFEELDRLPAPDLQRPIQTRVQRLRQPDHPVTGAEQAWRHYERRQRITARLTQLFAAAAIVALGIGLALIFHYARTAAPARPKPTPPATAGIMAWVNRPAPAYSPPPQASPTPYPTGAAPCVAAQLRVSAGPSGAAAGNELEGFTLTNVSQAPCLLGGRPGVTGLNAAGQRVNLSPRPNTFFGPLAPADIAPGAQGYIYFGTGNACGSGAEQQTSTEYRALSFDLPSGGRLNSQLTLSVGSCGLTMDNMGLPAPGSSPAYPPAGSLGTLDAHIDLPTAVRVGDTLRYTVVLRNPTATAVSLSSCPSYTETLGYPSNRNLTFMLNCDQVTVIPPGGQVVYAMQFKVPSDAVTGFTKFGWQLNDPDGPFAGGALTIN